MSDRSSGSNNEIEQLLIDSPKKSAVIRGNILMADTEDGATGIRFKTCLSDQAVAELHDNVFLNNATLGESENSNCEASIAQMQLLENPIQNAGGTASGNVHYKGGGQCFGQPGCLELAACSGASGQTQSCFAQLFTAWSGDGTTELFADGWKLKANSAPCPIARGATTLSVNVDLYNAPRTVDLSRGAHELDGPCF